MFGHSHRGANFFHRCLRRPAGASGSVLEHFPGFAGILLIMSAPLLHRIQHRYKCVGSPALALDAANPSTATSSVYLLQCISGAENFVHISNRAYVGIAWVSTAN